VTTTNEQASRPRADAVEVHGLTKSFGSVQALRGLDLTVPVSEVTGFLGPNGSGKSTTIRILLGLLRADGGHASVLGGDPWADAVRLHRSIAYVPGDVTLWPNLTGGEAIDILCRLSGPLDPKRKQVMLERFDLDPTKKARQNRSPAPYRQPGSRRPSPGRASVAVPPQRAGARLPWVVPATACKSIQSSDPSAIKETVTGHPTRRPLAMDGCGRGWPDTGFRLLSSGRTQPPTSRAGPRRQVRLTEG